MRPEALRAARGAPRGIPKSILARAKLFFAPGSPSRSARRTSGRHKLGGGFLMDLANPTLQLCIQGTEAEFQRRPDDARALYQQAWDSATDDYEACIAAHYVARVQDTPEETFRWNWEALRRANAVNDERVTDFYPSLYVNLGKSYELLGNQEEAERLYGLAAELGLEHER